MYINIFKNEHVKAARRRRHPPLCQLLNATTFHCRQTTIMKRTTEFFNSQGTRCEAWLYRPTQVGASLPVIVMAHGLGGRKAVRLYAFAERFAAAGYIVLLFDYRYFGGSEGHPRGLLDIQCQLQDWEAAIAHARALPGADPSRVIAWGTSLAGGHVQAVAARDRNLAAAIVQCPFTDGRASGGKVPLWTKLRIVSLVLRDVIGSRLGLGPVYINVSGPPGSVALMTAPDAYLASKQMLVASGLDPEIRNPVTARIGLQIINYQPAQANEKISCPVFAVLCEKDSVAPAAPAQLHLQRIPKVEIRLYPYGHFDIYLGQAFERVVADEIAFLLKHVPPQGVLASVQASTIHTS